MGRPSGAEAAATHTEGMERTAEGPTTEMFGVPVWDPGRIYLAIALIVLVVAVLVVVGLLERADNRRRADEYAAEQQLRPTRSVR